MNIRLCFTGRATRITADEYRTYIMNNRAPLADMAIGTPNVLRTNPNTLQAFDFYGEEAQQAEPDGALYHHAEIQRYRIPPIQTKSERLRVFCDLAMEHFVGVGRDDRGIPPEVIADLPLAPLLLFFNHPNTLFPPSVVPRLVADFANLESDGAEREFLHRARREFQEHNLGKLYVQIRQGVIDTEKTNGSFIYSFRH